MIISSCPIPEQAPGKKSFGSGGWSMDNEILAERGSVIGEAAGHSLQRAKFTKDRIQETLAVGLGARPVAPAIPCTSR